MTALTSLSDCERDEPKTELEKLPPITQEGKNTFGCLVNGKAWVTKTSIDAAAVYQQGILQVDAMVQSKSFFQSQFFLIRYPKEGSFMLNDTVNSRIFMIDSNTRCEYITDDLNGSGTLSISKFDLQKKVVSGVFEFSVRQSTCEELIVTNGRFDLSLIQ